MHVYSPRWREGLAKQLLIYATHVHLNHIASLYTVYVVQVQVRWYNNSLSYLMYRSLPLSRAVFRFLIRSVAMELVSV